MTSRIVTNLDPTTNSNSDSDMMIIVLRLPSSPDNGIRNNPRCQHGLRNEHVTVKKLIVEQAVVCLTDVFKQYKLIG